VELDLHPTSPPESWEHEPAQGLSESCGEAHFLPSTTRSIGRERREEGDRKTEARGMGEGDLRDAGLKMGQKLLG
jgi:hypothetical protein